MEEIKGRKKGFLQLKGDRKEFKKFAKAWVIVDAWEGNFHVYKDELSLSSEPLFSLPLLGLEVRVAPKPESKHPFSLLISSKRVKADWSACADTQEEMHKWYCCIRDGSLIVSPVIFGTELEVAVLKPKSQALGGIPAILVQACEYLSTHMQTDGIFRVSGSHDEVNSLQKAFDTGNEVDLNACTNPHNVSNILKLYFRELPDPLLTYALYDKFISVATQSLDTQLHGLAMVLSELPKAHRDTLKYLLDFLHKVSDRSEESKMTAFNLAVVFGPTIMRAKEETLASAGNSDLVNSLVETMIQRPKAVFLGREPSLAENTSPLAAKRVPQIGMPGPVSNELANRIKGKATGVAAPPPKAGGSFLNPAIAPQTSNNLVKTGNSSSFLGAPATKSPAAIPPKALAAVSKPVGLSKSMDNGLAKRPIPAPPSLGTPSSSLDLAATASPISLSEVESVPLPPPIIAMNITSGTPLPPAVVPVGGKAGVDSHLENAEAKMAELERIQAKNADLLTRIRKHLEH